MLSPLYAILSTLTAFVLMIWSISERDAVPLRLTTVSIIIALAFWFSYMSISEKIESHRPYILILNIIVIGIVVVHIITNFKTDYFLFELPLGNLTLAMYITDPNIYTHIAPSNTKFDLYPEKNI